MKPICAPLSEPRSRRLLLAVTFPLPARTRQCWNTCHQCLTSFHPLCHPLCRCHRVSLLLGLPPFPSGAAPASSAHMLSPEQWDALCPAVCAVSGRAACVPCSPSLPPGCGSLPGPLPGPACPPRVPAAAGRPGQAGGQGWDTHTVGNPASLWGRNSGMALAPGGTKRPHSAVECP